MPISVLLTESYHPFLVESLRQHPTIHLTHIENPSPALLYDAISEAEVWIMRGTIAVTEALLEKAHRLQLIIRAGSGVDHIEKEALKRRRIKLYSTPHVNALPVAEYVLTALLMLSRRFLIAHHHLKESGRWLRRNSMGRELGSLTVGIIGFGQNGSRTAYLLAALGARVLAYDKYKGGFGGFGIRETTLEEIFAEADVLSLHIPLTTETKGLVNADFLRRFQRPVALINAARGEIVELSAILEALLAGRLWGVALDTLPYEPPERLAPPDYAVWEQLRRHPAVLLTPHIAGLTEESELRLARAVLTLLESWLHRQSDPYSDKV
ncbi:MAG: phosphoglycerate dehydrogenase [Bacteroidia bacterium]|nr:phosphoglycerate dehydrogenase [Bacteroidia bacterium]